MDKKVQEYIDKQKSPQKEIILELRKIFFTTLKHCDEKFGWGVISLDDDRFYLVGLKERVHIGFAINGLSNGEISQFEGNGKTMRHIKIRSINDIDRVRLTQLIKLVHEKSAGIKE